jgi:hypothetical protein
MRLSHDVPHKEALILFPLPTTEYHTPGCVCVKPPQFCASPVPVGVAFTVVPLTVCPHVIGVALHIKSLTGGVGGAAQVNARLKADAEEYPETKM